MSRVQVICDFCKNVTLKHECYLDKSVRKFCDRKCYANFQKITPGNTAGKHWKLSEEVRSHMRGPKPWMVGRIIRQETKDKIKKSILTSGGYKGIPPVMRGANHPRWKGGMGTERHRVMGTLKYTSWRNSVFLKDNYTCQFCDQYSGMLHADHIKPWAEFPDLRYDTNNGRTLCRACHFYITFKRKMPLSSKWGLVNVIKKEG